MAANLNTRYGNSMTDTPAQTPPGWYPNQYGQTQWWDGNSWGPVAPQQQTVAYRPEIKSTGVAYCLLIFLGGTGAHRFYLGDTGRAVTMLLLFLFAVPVVAAMPEWGALGVMALVALWIMQIIDLFTLAGDVRRYNNSLYGIA